MHGRPRAAIRPAAAALARRAVGPAPAAVRGRRRGPVRGLLRLRRAWLLLGPWLADAGADPRPVRRVPGNAPTACRSHAAQDCSAPSSGTASTPWRPARKPPCATSSCAAGRGRRTSAGRSSTTARPTWMRSPPCCRRMLPGILGRQRDARIALGQALLRGRYMAAAARIEWAGVPIDTAMLPAPPDGLGRHQGPAGRGGRRALRRVRGHHLQGRPLRRLPGRRGHPLAATALRRAGAGRRHVPRPGQDLAGAAAPARTAPRPGRAAARGAGRGLGRAQPLSALGLPLAHRPQPAQQQQVHLRPGDLAALADPAGARHGPGLRRLQLAGDGHRRRALRRSGA